MRAPVPRAVGQGVNDVLIFAVMVSSSLTAGVVVTGSGGWEFLAELTLPFLALTSLATSILWLREHRRRTPARRGAPGPGRGLDKAPGRD